MQENILIKTALILAAGLFLAGCASSSGVRSDLRLSKDDNRRTVDVNRKSKIIIELPSNPSTGYRWERINTDGSLIHQDGESIYTERDDCNGMDGCGGTERLSFKAARTGSGDIAIFCG